MIVEKRCQRDSMAAESVDDSSRLPYLHHWHVLITVAQDAPGWRHLGQPVWVPLALEGDMGTGASTRTGQPEQVVRQPERGKAWLRAALADVEAYSETVL